ncbi:hypothetical protein BAZMOX_02029_3 [methanotrophic endosymbiont of Bathymodiolus azoricus (Menez Gwen)]|nr:hypothetical protein BAZMOX_02029_3 [methanotrophic endosymbiont of Bathymodiolus azoricus (Menez Gwen)]
MALIPLISLSKLGMQFAFIKTRLQLGYNNNQAIFFQRKAF